MKTMPLRALAILVLLGALGLGACQPHGEELPPVSEELPEGVPDGAIKATDTLYMVPVGPDADGCEQYSAHAVDGLAPAVIYYRKGDGTFTPDKSEAACG